MTREEAIRELQNCKGLIQQDGQDYLDERDIPLLDMAIEALSADVVSRDVYDKRIQADEEIIDSYREKLANCHKEILRLLDFDDAIERQNDVIEVVRCKDCRHAYFKDFDKYCRRMVGALKPNQFCSFGELAEQTEGKMEAEDE